MTRLVPNPWHKQAEAAERSALQLRRMVVDEEEGCYVPVQLQEKSYRLVPKGELKVEQFPKAVVEALRREGEKGSEGSSRRLGTWKPLRPWILRF